VKYLLSDHQKKALTRLFQISPDDEFTKDLFLNIEYMMEEPFLPDKSSSKSVMVKKIALLNEVSEAAKKLRLLLSRVDDFTLDGLDHKLGSCLGKPYEHDTFIVGGKAAICWDPISSIDAVKQIEIESKFIAGNYGENYKTNATWAIEGLKKSWPYQLGIEITLSEHSVFIKYLAVILKEESTDKLVKQCQRSGLFPTPNTI
jgi:hypothetical protein